MFGRDEYVNNKKLKRKKTQQKLNPALKPLALPRFACIK